MALDIGPDIIVTLPLQELPPSPPNVPEGPRHIPESVWAAYDHRAMCIAASAVAATFRPRGEKLQEVQTAVDTWLSTEYADKQGPQFVQERIRGLVGHLRARYIGAISLFDLDATEALMDRLATLDYERQEGIVAPEVLPPRSLLLDAPALVYASPASRAALIQGLPESYKIETEESKAEAPVVAETAHKNHEAKKDIQFGLRNAREEDIPTLVEVDLKSFSKVYQGKGYADPATLRTELIQKFTNRYRLLGGKWMPVITREDENGKEQILGFMVGCPTSKSPDDFESWEQITDNGTLTSLYDPKGKNLYVVTLSVDPSVKGERGQDQLYARMISNIVKNGIQTTFFESRMPGLSAWVNRQCRTQNRDPQNLTDAEKATFAQEYSLLTRNIKGKKVMQDSLLRLYTNDFGCKLQRIVPNAYEDEQSMNFGALYTFDNPLLKAQALPNWLRNSWPVSKVVGTALSLVATSTKLTNRLMKAL